MDTDILIVGAGIAGLRCGIEILHRSPNQTVAILEKYNYTGGRVVTYKKKLEDVKGKCTNVQWENGAGRIHSSHKEVIDLVKRYKLTLVPLSKEQDYISDGVVSENNFEALMHLFSSSLSQLDPSLLANHTLREIVEMILHEKADSFLLQFPYRAEVDTLRADLALQSFQGEMGTYENYFVLQEGLSALINAMVNEFEKLGGQIFHKQSVENILQEKDGFTVVSKTPAGEVVWSSKRVICALHSEALKKIPIFSKWSTLKHLQMEPLFRIYAVFPTKGGKSWFTDMHRIVSPGPIRYFIPINPSCGISMISYTDGKDARHLEKILSDQGEEKLEEYVVNELRTMFPAEEIPDPLFFKPHPWYEGCTYWLPGSYDPYTLSKEAVQPFPKISNLYCCGESFSTRQAWMEGALEHADLLINRLTNSLSKKTLTGS